jgi:serine/threonine protein kinase
LRCIGRGSYGEVWLARTTLGTFRAVKVVYRSDFEEARPYEREYSGIRKYEPISRSHEGLVDVLQVGRNDGEGYFYYVMELADAVKEEVRRKKEETSSQKAEGSGQTLEDGSEKSDYEPRTLSAERRRHGRLPAREAIDLGVSLSAALAELHRAGLIHRDIKPSNIIFVDGVAKLADIGLVTDAAESGSYVGTEGFIPPEGPNSPQADVFSLGKVLYEVSMGKDRLDFPEPATELDALPDRDLLVELNTVLLKACQPDRRLRHASAAELHAELRLLQRGKSIRERRLSERRLRWLTAGTAGLAAVTLLAFGIERVLDWRTRAMQGQSSLIRPSLVNLIAPRDPKLPGELIDLSPAYTAPLTEKWYPGPQENTLSNLPQGLQTIAGTRFDVRGLVQLAGREIARYGADLYPVRVGDIPVERWVQRLHFLHGAVSEVAEGMRIGSYRVFYNTGRECEVPVIYGRNVRALWQPRSESGTLPDAVVAWRGQNPATQARGMELRLYRFTWENPWPAEEIVEVDFNSAQANAAPFLVALTADDALIAPDQRRVSVSLAESIQRAATGFPQLSCLVEGEPSAWTSLKLNARPVEIGGRYYDGFRFTTPKEGAPDFIWSFRPASTPIQGWFILPMTGGLKVGFEDWYHVAPGPKRDGSRDPQCVVQYLSGKKLQPGREYFIWFGSDTNRPVDLQVALRFVSAGIGDPNQPESLIRALGFSTAATNVSHRHYCLGAIR